MKNLLALFLLLAIAFACSNNSNNGDGNEAQTKDSLQQLLRDYRDSIKKYPNDTELKYNFVTTLQEAGKYKEALGILDSLNFNWADSANRKKLFELPV